MTTYPEERSCDQMFWKAIDAIPYWRTILAVWMTLGVNIYETFYPIGAGATVVDGSLKFTNILYALPVFLLLCKIDSNVKFGFLNPRDETYPFYQIHLIFLKVINYAVLPMLPAVCSLLILNAPAEVSWLTILLYQTGWFLAIYDFPDGGKDRSVQSFPMDVWKRGKNGCIPGTVISVTDQ
jgi:hypothetical protein